MTDMVSCRGCGKEIHKTAATCPLCGAPQRTKRYKSKVGAGVLAILLGGLGVHRFYLGQWWGIFYLLFFWTWIPGIVALIEGIVILLTNDEKWDKKYNEGIPGTGEGSTGVIIAAVVGVFAFVFIAGILAAIAIPAYQDYTLRAKVADAMQTADRARLEVERFAHENRTWPASNADVPVIATMGGAYVDGMDILRGGTIVIHLSKNAGVIAGDTIELTPRIEEGVLKWSCGGGTLPVKYRPRACRQPQ